MVEFMAIYLLKPAPADGGTGKAEAVVCPYPCSTDPLSTGPVLLYAAMAQMDGTRAERRLHAGSNPAGGSNG